MGLQLGQLSSLGNQRKIASKRSGARLLHILKRVGFLGKSFADL